MSHILTRFCMLGVFLCCVRGNISLAQSPPTPTANAASAPSHGLTDTLPDGSAAAEKQIPTFRAPDGFTVRLFAGEPQLASPVAIGVDEQNRVFVAEEYRFNRGTEENRTRAFLLEDDLQVETLDDRLKMFEKHAAQFEGGMDWFRKYTDQVRLVTDTNGDGRADHSTVFASGFNEPLDGLAAGVMAFNGDVYLTCIPHLWRLRDKDGDGVSDEREKVATGFGVNAGFLGHDLHGLCWGPEGKLYFSVGDRGYDLHTKEGRAFHGPRNGAVFRCFPDGSQLEVVYTGLRNPQEIAFDAYGNLFAADNNCDKGDHSRLVYIVDGGHSGWNMAYQSLLDPYLTGPWHAEKIWHVEHPDRPLSVLPPIAPLGAGPSGFAFSPGLGLPERYRQAFFMCNFTGNGGIEAFSLKAKGAGFEMVDAHDFLKPIFASDCEFGYDGNMYVSDFIGLNWDGRSVGGRLYTVRHSLADGPEVGEVKTLFAAGFTSRPSDELEKLLAHGDLRVRQRAQFALAARGAESIPVLQRALKTGPTQLAKLHGLWGLWQLGGTNDEARAAIREALGDPDSELRAQAARVMADLRLPGVEEGLLSLLFDPSPRVQAFASRALGRTVTSASAVKSLLALAERANDTDPFVRHEIVMALAEMNSRDAVLAHRADPSRAVRAVVLLTLRKWAEQTVAQPSSSETPAAALGPGRALVDFLRDADLALATEAARAIHDLPLPALWPQLAEMAAQVTLQPSPEALVRRVLSANLKLGDAASIQRVVQIARSVHTPPQLQAEALDELAMWASPSPRDRVNGYWRPVPARDPASVKEALTPLVPELLTLSGPLPDKTDLAVRVTKLIEVYQLPVDEGLFARWVADDQTAEGTRIAALQALEHRKSDKLIASLDAALASQSPPLRSTARTVLSRLQPDRALGLLTEILSTTLAVRAEQQAALKTLSSIDSPAAEQQLTAWADHLEQGTLTPELQWDLVQALRASSSASLKARVATFEAKLISENPDALLQMTEQGGNAARGRDLFINHAVAQCIRCHKHARAAESTLNTTGGTAGPDLTEIAKRHPEQLRSYLLRSLLDPKADIAKGYETVTLALADGRVVAGVVVEETPDHLRLKQPDGRIIEVPTKEIDDRSPANSAMPSMRRTLAPDDLRDLIEFLAE